MKCNYKIYETKTESDEDTTLMEMMLVKQAEKNFSPKVVIRPKISVLSDVFKLIISAVIALILMVILCISDFIPTAVCFLICISIGIIWIIVNFRRTIITMIIIYQKYAPEYVRSTCVFEPCCSEYMKRAILKYGTLKGFFKGIKRIIRCRYPNGGIDEP